jgi:hypothetical protein
MAAIKLDIATLIGGAARLAMLLRREPPPQAA